jgi:hypothetical protein
MGIAHRNNPPLDELSRQVKTLADAIRISPLSPFLSKSLFARRTAKGRRIDRPHGMRPGGASMDGQGGATSIARRSPSGQTRQE